jgi:hypothetical protein
MLTGKFTVDFYMKHFQDFRKRGLLFIKPPFFPRENGGGFLFYDAIFSPGVDFEL